MPVRPLARAVPLLAALLLAACSDPVAAPTRGEAPPAVDPASRPAPEPHTEPAAGPAVEAEPYEVSLTADFGPLPDGSGDAVVETVWTVDAAGTRQLLIHTPAGPAARHVMTDDEHWWWLHPSTRETVADVEWVHVDLRQVEEIDAELPEVVAEARVPLPPPGEIVVGQIVAGHEVLAVEVVHRDEAHLTVAGIERPVVHRRRRLPARTAVEVPVGAAELADLPDTLRS